MTPKRKESNARWADANPEKVKAYQKFRRERDKVKMARQKKDWYERNKKYVIKRNAAYYRKRMAEDPIFRLISRMRTRVCQELVSKRKNVKPESTLNLLGCDRNQFKIHLKSRFQPGMTFDNYGLWHVDHRIPVCKFDLTDADQVRKCFHYTNLQPLWARDNFLKKLTDGSQEIAVQRRKEAAC